MIKKLFQIVPETPPCFDQILPLIKEWQQSYGATLSSLLQQKDAWLLINRDLNGRVRLILPSHVEQSKPDAGHWQEVAARLMERLGQHAYSAKNAILYEASLERVRQGAASWKLEGSNNTWIADRLATEGDWARIAPASPDRAPRIVFFSIKGGVGRSSALAACAWDLAQTGKRVLVLDLDLESPGLSSSLLPPQRQPQFGITDWLVEDLVDNTQEVLQNMVATSELAHDGEIYVVPAHGAQPGEYISKLGRVWMPKLNAQGRREPWSERLQRMLQQLEARIQPDVVLIDSRAGIDEVASSCVTDLGANLVLLFAIEGSQTWSGYRILFEHWQRAQVAQQMRERLQIVAAMVPELDRAAYLEGLRESAYEVFVDTLYDEIRAPAPDDVGPNADEGNRWRVGALVEGWSFDEADEGAPHHPWPVNWHRSFAGLRSLHGRLAVIDAGEIAHIFGPLLDGVRNALGKEGRHD